ncbi:MAG: DNA-3-methyladenine glycosylase I [Verrucomicrobia bacterium]|nr:DNA-3-methyladenine glycosylase I [Verrucomicrobiota bacterium]
MKKRCPWAQGALYEQYHDTEWGVPVHDDRKHFEFLVLEGAQAGLSWLTILKRREGYRKAFADFDPAVVAKFDQKKIEELMLYEGIIRNRLKITSCVSNAKLFLDIQKEWGSFDKYIWSFVKGKTICNARKTIKEVPPKTPESTLLSKDLQKRGFKFVGPTVMYAHMQATGLVNDHLIDCPCYKRWEVYIIRAENGKLYTGITNDLERRFADHQKGKKGAKFFRISGAKEIVYRESHPDRSAASKREAEIKSFSLQEKLNLC